MTLIALGCTAGTVALSGGTAAAVALQCTRIMAYVGIALAKDDVALAFASVGGACVMVANAKRSY